MSGDIGDGTTLAARQKSLGSWITGYVQLVVQIAHCYQAPVNWIAQTQGKRQR